MNYSEYLGTSDKYVDYQKMNKFQDSPAYLKKKAFIQQLLTIYGRKPVLEALNDSSLTCFRLHLAESNKPIAIIQEMENIAQQKQIDIVYHSRQALSRISKNGKQDQGVCLDIHCPYHQNYRDFLEQHKTNNTCLRLLALDRITNPQNLGMILRSACAGKVDGILLSEKGCAKLDALVIKASAGTIFKAPLLKCDDLYSALEELQANNMQVIGLSGHAANSLKSFNEPNKVVYILGNETEGMSKAIERLCDKTVSIPMSNNVESLNVAATASLLAFRGLI